MQLHKLQSQFGAQLFGDQQTDVENLIESHGFGPSQRINIYRNNINSTLTESLANIYPVTCIMVGSDFFKMMAQKYCRTHPSQTGDLRDYGEHLPAFMRNMPKLKDFPYLPDLAEIDWSCHLAYHAHSTPTLSVSSLGHYSTEEHENLRFTLHPAIHTIESEYPVFDIWEYATSDDQNQTTPDIKPRRQQVLVHREEYSVRVVNIDKTLFDLFKLIGRQQNLGKIIPSILAADPNYNLQEGLYRLFAYNAITKITVHHP